MEEMRIDPANTIGPLRVNAWVSILVFVISVTVFVGLGRRRRATRATDVTSEPDVESTLS